MRLDHTDTLAEAACAPAQPAALAREAGPAALATLLQASRADTLRLFADFQARLPALRVPQRPELNPPLWELGHIGWFQGWWTTRFAAWRLGAGADPDAPRKAFGFGLDGDALYDSSTVPHASRWSLPLPDARATCSHLAAQLDATLAQLQALPPDASGTELYFFRLALLHEDMHHEAALYMAHGLGIEVDDVRWQPQPLPAPPPALAIPGGPVELGCAPPTSGFAFDNELGSHCVPLQAFEIDAQALRWDEFLLFVEAPDGYCRRGAWTDAGWARLHEAFASPQHRIEQLRVQARPGTAAMYLSAHEARAWCRWAGRRLPTEPEWLQAQRYAGAAFRWGDVWEWTASAFTPFEGFRPHPYRDYSAPWFDGRPVLKGASCLTQPRLRHPAYRNFFPASRCDIPAGLRTCRAG